MKIFKHAGKVFLALATLFITVGPASAAYVGVEEIPQSMKNKR